MNFSDNTVLSVKALNDFVKRIVDTNNYLSSVNIRGEISNFTNHYKSGHLYFSVKDEEAQIRCVMFSSNASKLTVAPENGMKVKAHGRVSMFVRDGQFIFYVDNLECDGVGELHLKFEATKKKLAEEGLFDPLNKKAIPRYPKAVGIITSDTGAAIEDIKNIISRRYPMAEMILYPSLVQGSGAEDELCRGIDYFDNKQNVDTLIIGRGGGSIEDLWAFNSEKLARRIYACKIPIISAVGHETDFTICDFAADLRAPTPSAAAELAVPDSKVIIRQLNNVITKMQTTIYNKISIERLKLERLSKTAFLNNPEYMIDDKRMYTEHLKGILCNNMQSVINRCLGALSNVGSELNSSIMRLYNQKKTDYVAITSKLSALNPMEIISRGYSVVFDKEGSPVKSISDISIDDYIDIKLSDGVLTAKTVDKKEQIDG